LLETVGSRRQPAIVLRETILHTSHIVLLQTLACIARRFVWIIILLIDYCLNSVTTLTQGIWISFLDTEEAHAVMLAYAANGGPVDHRSSGPGSLGKSRLKVPAQPALLNGSLLFLHRYLETGIQQGEVQKHIHIPQ
jgi:hypothetical protein